VSAAAAVAADQLPDYLQECAIVYLPEMGHLIAIKEWSPGCNPEDLKELGFHFMVITFDTSAEFFFKFYVFFSVHFEGNYSL
jgi:hypothetical protein